MEQHPAGYYYYCDRLHAYYPAVPTCPEGWVAIPVAGPPPVFEEHWVRHHWEDPPGSEQWVTSRPNTVSLELFGRALLYSLDFDRAITSHITLGVGVSYWHQSDWWQDYSANVTVVPVYMNYYFSESPRRGYVSVGADWITVSNNGGSDENDTFTNSGVAAVVGGGYEYRDNSNFFMRIGGYLIIGRSTELSPSVNLGFAF
jgi:hypothetical protein